MFIWIQIDSLFYILIWIQIVYFYSNWCNELNIYNICILMLWFRIQTQMWISSQILFPSQNPSFREVMSKFIALSQQLNPDCNERETSVSLGLYAFRRVNFPHFAMQCTSLLNSTLQSPENLGCYTKIGASMYICKYTTSDWSQGNIHE
jgi:hypothetical protein